jgi:hypothetical protein
MGCHFAPELGGHFELESGAHFKLELDGQYHWNLHTHRLLAKHTVSFCKDVNENSLAPTISQNHLVCNLFF